MSKSHAFHLFLFVATCHRAQEQKKMKGLLLALISKSAWMVRNKNTVACHIAQEQKLNAIDITCICNVCHSSHLHQQGRKPSQIPTSRRTETKEHACLQKLHLHLHGRYQCQPDSPLVHRHAWKCTDRSTAHYNGNSATSKDSCRRHGNSLKQGDTLEAT